MCPFVHIRFEIPPILLSKVIYFLNLGFEPMLIITLQTYGFPYHVWFWNSKKLNNLILNLKTPPSPKYIFLEIPGSPSWWNPRFMGGRRQYQTGKPDDHKQTMDEMHHLEEPPGKLVRMISANKKSLINETESMDEQATINYHNQSSPSAILLLYNNLGIMLGLWGMAIGRFKFMYYHGNYLHYTKTIFLTC